MRRNDECEHNICDAKQRHGNDLSWDFTPLPDLSPSHAHDMDPVGGRVVKFWFDVQKWIMLTTGPCVEEPAAVQPLNATLIPSATLMF